MPAGGAVGVDDTIQSGQVFLWRREGAFWYGVDGPDVLRVDGAGRVRSASGRRPDFFRKRDDMGAVIGDISRDAAVRRAVRRYPGLRLTDQDPFQCLISFIVSANSSIQKIRSCLWRLCERFGGSVEMDGTALPVFPSPRALAGATAGGIARCGTGYRSRFVREAARMVADGRLDLGGLRRAGYGEAMEALLGVPGVGGKVADCVMLFSLDKPGAFPLDRWTGRILARHHPRLGIGPGPVAPGRYMEMHGRIAAHFGPYAGYAQQYLFKAEREEAGRGWL